MWSWVCRLSWSVNEDTTCLLPLHVTEPDVLHSHVEISDLQDRKLSRTYPEPGLSESYRRNTPRDKTTEAVGDTLQRAAGLAYGGYDILYLLR